MDKKKKIITTMRAAFCLCVLLASTLQIHAQDVKQIQFCDKQYSYEPGKDSITLFFRIHDSNGKRITDINQKSLEEYLAIKENGEIIPRNNRIIQPVNTGKRIPSDYTFSVLIDLNIPEDGKRQIYDIVGQLVKSAPDSCVYISFFGDQVSSSELVTSENFENFKSKFLSGCSSKFFYGALYAKLVEFSSSTGEYENAIQYENGYRKNADIQKRARDNKDKNILFIFTEGSKRAEIEELDYLRVTDYQSNMSHDVPKVFALYYTGNGVDENVKLTLEGVSTPRDTSYNIIQGRQGMFRPSDDMSSVLAGFEEAVNEAMYDYAFIYKAFDKSYSGEVEYTAEWQGEDLGNKTFTIGTEENPWPVQIETATDTVMKYLIALLTTLLTVAFFFFVVKILIPIFKSKAFATKYYKKYEPEPGVQRRICHYCKRDLQPGDRIVAKCKHYMHILCWRQNGYRCSEYGQNCNTGIQEHVEWDNLFTKASFRDCHQTIVGIIAGLISWIVFELLGRGGFNALANVIVKTFYNNDGQTVNLFNDCVTKVSAFLLIGLLLGFFLSLVFRYNDEYRKKDWKIYLKILGLSLLSGIIGMAAFAIGACILCALLPVVKTTYLPWYCSLPAYMLFSICVSLSLTIKSSVPVKSAMIGGICSAIIGFLVLYFSSMTSTKWGWMNMLLDFIIYGGGLGASLVTVRMLAEKYFLVIQNGVKAGQRIPIHKWMNATGGGNKVSIGMTGECEIQMNWEKSNKVAKEHAQLFIDHNRNLPMIKPLATGVIFNTRAELPVGKPSVLSNGDTFKIGDTIFQYVEND
ncbi:MAG: FHA domain-containing protein [Muribaculaceae bacterium]|nr:FHA domain-containing protein [Muribaculaceae bacterium]